MTPAAAAAGDEVVVRGEAWGPCNDTPNDPPEPDWTSVSLEWTLGIRSWDAGTVEVVDATFERTVRVPVDADGGGLMLTVTGPDFVARTPLTLGDSAASAEGD